MTWFYKHPHGSAYYNDFDTGACAWLRELMKVGAIAPGVIDNRSILDVTPKDLDGFAQCHFFAGIGGWSYALRLAGWSDDRPVWTGSPPCQPFSAAGARKGKEDERHLAPHFIDLVRACRPGVLFGEQVASAAVFGKAAKSSRNASCEPPAWAWIDDLSDRLEAACYAVGAVDFPSAGVGAPHIRQRTFFGAVDLGSASDGLGDADNTGLQGQQLGWIGPDQWSSGPTGVADGLADAAGWDARPERQQRSEKHGLQSKRCSSADRLADYEFNGQHRSGNIRACGRNESANSGTIDGLAYARCNKSGGEFRNGEKTSRISQNKRESIECPHVPCGRCKSDRRRAICRSDGLCDNTRTANPTNGFWTDADWLGCRDGKWRPVEPGTFPLAHGVSGRVGLLRGYGNAINPWAAKEFIEAFEEAANDSESFRMSAPHAVFG